MTGLLVSVRDGSEAQLAVQAGVDVLDVKEPSRGSLGAADPSIVAQVAAIARQRMPLSVALGELLDVCASSPSGPWSLGQWPPGVAYAKLGLSRCAACSDWIRRWRNWAASLPEGVSPVAVAYADAHLAASPSEGEILAVAASLGAAAVLVDTFDKSSGNLLTHWGLDRIEAFLVGARQRNMPVVLAGSLTGEQIETLLPLNPRLIAVRGAACHGGRAGQLDPLRLRRLVDTVHRAQPAHGTPAGGPGSSAPCR